MEDIPLPPKNKISTYLSNSCTAPGAILGGVVRCMVKQARGGRGGTAQALGRARFRYRLR